MRETGEKRSRTEMEPDTPPGVTVSEKRFMTLLQEALEPIHKRLDEIQETQAEMTDETKYFHSTINDTKASNTTLVERINHLEEENKTLKQRLVFMEQHYRRSNLRFHGIEEKKDENPEKLVLDELRKHGFVMNSRDIDNAHRIGPKTKDRIRPIIVRFHRYKDKQAIWAKLGHKTFAPSHNKPHIREDFPKEVERDRAQLQAVAHAIVKKPSHDQPTPYVNVIGNKMIIDRKTYTTDTLHTLPKHLHLQEIYTPMNDNTAAFFTGNSPLSSHYMEDFKVNGETFNCAEQYILVQKARLFNDQEAVINIMKESDPIQQKKAGKNIKNFDTEAWKSNAKELIKPGLEAKFSQCTKPKELLLRTGNRQIIEANPNDLFLGAGISLHSPKLWDISEHKGMNIMGKMLCEVRATLTSS